MSKEVMTICLEEAAGLCDSLDMYNRPEVTMAVATIAVALYQERMRETHRRGFPLGAGYGDTNLGTGGVK